MPSIPAFFRKLLSSGVVLLLLALGIGGYVYQVRTARHARKVRPKPSVYPVRVMRAIPVRRTVVVEGTGTVEPARRLELRPQVSGRVVQIAQGLEPGAVFKKGVVLVRIEPDDFRDALAEAEARRADAEYNLRLEQGRQIVARREWESLPPSARKRTDQDLVLRRPHLARVQAALAAAKAGVDRARRNLERTVIRAPFDAVVLEKRVEFGQQVSPQTALVVLAGVHRYWVRAELPVEDLAWLDFPDRAGHSGSAVRVERRDGNGVLLSRKGRILRLLADVSSGGRLARVLVGVDAPLRPDPKTGVCLLIGDYVHVAFQGKALDDIIVLPRIAWREGDRVWVMNARDRLEIRKVRPVWRTPQALWIREASPEAVRAGRGVRRNERVVLSNLSAAVPGLHLREADEPRIATKSKPSTPAAAGAAPGRAPRAGAE